MKSPPENAERRRASGLAAPRWMMVVAGLVLAAGAPLVANGWLALADRFTAAGAPHVERGDRAMAEGRYTEAVIAYGRARQLRPGDGDLDLALMRARVHVIADEPARLQLESADELRYDADLLMAREPARAAACLTAIGHVLARRGDAAGARAKYEAAIGLDPGSHLARTALGVALLGDKDRAAQAAAELDAALKARPGHPAALIGLARLALGRGENEVAVKHLQAALAARDDFAAHLLLGNAQVRLKNLSDGIVHLQRAAELEPRSADALKSLGQALMAADRPAEAERPLRAAAQMDDVEALTGLGFALARQRKTGAALDAFTQALARDPGSPLALFGSGVALEDMGKREDAAAFYRRLLAVRAAGGREDPNLAEVQKDARARLSALEPGGEAPAPSPSARPEAKPRR